MAKINLRQKIYNSKRAFEKDSCPYCDGKIIDEVPEGKLNEWFPRCEKCRKWLETDYNDFLEALWKLCDCEKCGATGIIIIREGFKPDPDNEGEVIAFKEQEECKNCKGRGYHK